jgi:hypothetical protein
MVYRKWTVEIDGRSHIVELEIKGLGQRFIRVDGIEQVNEKKLVSLGSTNPIQVGAHTGQVQIHSNVYELEFPQADVNPEHMAQITVSAPQTERITIEKDPGGLSLFVDNRSRSAFFLVLVGLALALFGIWWIGLYLDDLDNLSSLLMPVVVFGFSLYIIYSSLRKAMNRMVYHVALHELSVREGPIPWFGNRMLVPDTLGGLHVERVNHRSSARSVPIHSYKLQAESKDSKRLTSIGEFNVADDAYFLSEQIGKTLNLPLK